MKNSMIILLLMATFVFAGVKEDLFTPTKTDSLMWKINQRAILYTQNYKDPTVYGILAFSNPIIGNIAAGAKPHKILFSVCAEVYCVKMLIEPDENLKNKQGFLWIGLLANHFISYAFAVEGAELNNQRWRNKLRILY